MKKCIYILIALLGLTVTSCSQKHLEIPQKSVDDLETYMANAGEAEVNKLVASIYYGMHNCYDRPWILIANEITGENYAGGSDPADQPFHVKFSTLAITADNGQLGDVWNKFYNAIYRCNLIIDKLAGEESYKVRARAEAKAVRAWCHTNLVMCFGDVPLVDHLLEVEEYEMARTPKDQVWAAIEADFTAAAAALPSKSGLGGQKAIGGRWTKEAALGYLAKAQLYQGKYADAVTNLNTVIGSGKYALLKNYGDIHRLAGDYSDEYLMEISNDATNQDEISNSVVNDYHRYGGLRPELIYHPDELWANSWGFLNATGAFGIEAVAHDGDAPRRLANVASFDEFIATDGNKFGFHYTANPAGLKADWFSSDGFARLKGLTYNADRDIAGISPNTQYSNANWPILRYADILLMYAECAANGAGDKAKGLEYFNMVRNRAGLGNATALSMDDPMTGIKAERRFEFFFENAERWYDLLRWGDFVSERQRQYTTYAPMWTAYPFLVKDPSDGTVPTWNPGGPAVRWMATDNEKPDAHHALLPIPYAEMTANPSLTQNPGY